MAEERLKSWETLFAQALEILDSAQPAAARLAGWTFGGGTALMRKHWHRISKDIDIFVPDPRWLGYLSPRLSAVAAAFTSDYVEQEHFVKLFLPQGEIDFVASGALTSALPVTERIRGRDVLVESSAEIIAKKVWHRGAAFAARDLFDFAVVAEKEPEAIGLVQHILAARRELLLQRLYSDADALREDFAALDVLDFRPSFESCVDAVRFALAQSAVPPSYPIEQPRAPYQKGDANLFVREKGLRPLFSVFSKREASPF